MSSVALSKIPYICLILIVTVSANYRATSELKLTVTPTNGTTTTASIESSANGRTTTAFTESPANSVTTTASTESPANVTTASLTVSATSVRNYGLGEEEYYPGTHIPTWYQKNITIGFLMNREQGSDKTVGLIIGGAFLYALDDVSSVFSYNYFA